MRSITSVAIGLAALLVGAAPILAQDDQACLMCHGNGQMFAGSRDSARLHVSPRVLANSVHGAANLQCAMCHLGMDFPHPDERPEPECDLCHRQEAEQHNTSLHGQAAARGDPLAPSCVDCHGGHNIRSHFDPRSPTRVLNIPFLCGECHHEGTSVSRTRNIPQDRILENYSESIHGEGLLLRGLVVTAVCTSCHTSHEILPHTDRRSSIHEANVAGTCMQCHGQIEAVHQQVIAGRLWEEEPHKIPACVDCHSPHKIRRVFYDAGAANRDCLSCHEDPTLTGVAQGDTVSLYVDTEEYAVSEHGETACAQCHSEVNPNLRRPCAAISTPVDCAVCHAGPASEYQGGIHGTLAAQGDTDAPTCLDCHSKHATKDRLDPTSSTFARNVPDLCAKCHRQGEQAAVRIVSDVPAPVESYRMSIHGTGLLQSGLTVTATCANCHSPHGELPASDERSTVHADNVADTCGKCHYGIEEIFQTSIHWPGNGKGDRSEHELPTCEDCHTSHTISRVDRGDFRLTMMNQCGRCHEDEAETFFDTFHGKVSRLGDEAAAKCYDCHGTHNILPTSEPTSLLSRRNVVETCSKCHKGVGIRFTGYLTHATHHDPEKYPWLFWTFWGMTALLIGTLSFALLHTLLWLWRLVWTPWLAPHAKPKEGEKLYRRFTVWERSMHGVMLLSFFTLALTGMVLKFSYMGWAQTFAAFLGGFATTGMMHRLGAIALIAIFAAHLWDVRKRKQGSGLSWRKFIQTDRSLIFTKRDLKEFGLSMKWFFGKGPRPNYGRYTYWEKFDYFAVFWGMFVIGSTGILLWFPEFFTILLPGWTVNVATILHSDEALLAVAFIFTVHFFNTHFRPDKFPMDPVIFTGRVPVEELKRDKPDEYQKLVDKGELEEHLVEPYPKKLERAFKVFGFTALAIGLALIALIIYSMLFGYR
ncbi:MAG: cytochrome c3 family protein [Gemmatimonadota bacterium]|nr:cytochrome c3 family protein [Gemmatimonadota bacterium]